MIEEEKGPFRLGIIGGGPAALFLLKKLVEEPATGISVTIIEKTQALGAGMPYSRAGARREHVTNISSNEIPELERSVAEWVQKLPKEMLLEYGMNPAAFSEYKVLPRLLFGKYLNDEFSLLLKKAKALGIDTEVHLATEVTDIEDDAATGCTIVRSKDAVFEFDAVVICTGHTWPAKKEQELPNWFDSPYPPEKIAAKINFPVALRGSSLTAIDAIKTLARANGEFFYNNGSLEYQPAPGSEDFKIVMHSIDGLLPAVRFHLEDPQLYNESVLTAEDIARQKQEQDGFVSLDWLFETNFKEPIRQKDPSFYEAIRHMNMEAFVAYVMELREKVDPFNLLEAEYIQAEKSIKRKQSVYWKEMLGVLSYSMNRPAKHFSAEDTIRLQTTLKPLISIVIAYVPQSSVTELLTLQRAGFLEVVAVDKSSTIEPAGDGSFVYTYTDAEGKPSSAKYKMFIDCIGQPALRFEEIPFKKLVAQKTLSAARIRFRDPEKALAAKEQGQPVEQDMAGNYYLRVPGVAINDCFQPLDDYGAANPRIYIMAVPFIGGFNPDYSGLDFCDTASGIIVTSLFKNLKLLHGARP